MSFFKPPKPKIEEPAPPPTIDDAREDLEARDRARRRRGRAATILASGSSGPTGAAVLGM